MDPGPSMDHLKVPYAERWDLLKDILVRLYIQEERHIKDIAEFMAIQYKFYASVNQYKRQFGIWKVKRALPTKKKIKISKEMETRAQQGKASMVLHNGKAENQKMRRFMKEQSRRDRSLLMGGAVDLENLSGHALQCGNRVFMNWSMPAAIIRFLKSKATDHISPNCSVGTPMSGVLVATPSSNSGPSPRNPPSPGNALSPNNERSAMTATVQESVKINRARLFVQKDHRSLLRGMNLQEQCITTDWMHQFWQYSFTTARNWGRGPRVWNSSNLRFSQFSRHRIESLPGTPAMNVNSPEQSFHHQHQTYLPRPSDLCHWSIHVCPVSYQRNKSPEPAQHHIDPEKEETWKPWSTAENIHDFAESLQQSLESNEFSTIEVRELPISTGQIIRAAGRSPEQLLEEAFGFSIMARNLQLIDSMLEHIQNDGEFTLHELFPLHLAASYLDGAKSCCGVFNTLVEGMPTGEASVRKLYINHLNHTVLDNLMIAILKAHTSCTPVMVDEAFKKEQRFAGEEVDICGRWDADSDCVRHLQANGSPTLPQSWKHMFCHTSAQAITHCIGTLFIPFWAPDINTPSGLFLKRCSNETCGLKLQLMPLHTLVVTAVYLAELGSEGENLFGIVACLLSLLGKGANPLLRANVSVMALLGDNDSQECTHSELDPLALADSVPQTLISRWAEERLMGWKVFCAVLRLSKEQWDPRIAPGPAIDTPNDGFRSLYSAFIEDGEDGGTISQLTDMDVDMESVFNDGSEESHMFDYSRDDSVGVPSYCPDHDETPYQKNYFGKNKNLATLWAAVQTELLTYRRQAEGDSWLSDNFDMASVLESLESGEDICIRLVSGGLLKPYCRCGIFRDLDDPACLRVEEACVHYFSNLEDWSRSTFISAPDDRPYNWDLEC